MPEDPVLQSAGEGRYTGPLLHDRYQVLESRAIKGSYFLADIQAQTAVRATSHKAVGDILRFDSVDEAEAYAAELAGQKVGKPIVKPTGKTIPTMNSSKPSARQDTAAAMFRRLILDGKLTDDEIFKEVQKAFGLADNRRSYVDWYRKELKKKGQLA